MTTRFTGTGRSQERGLSAVHKKDFNAHIDGGDWRHDATMIDMNPQLVDFPAETVQETIELLAEFASSKGTGFISIGSMDFDGYDGYALGSYNVGENGTLTLKDAFNSAFADERLTNGGIILLLAGTYRLANTIEVPAGVSVMGELAGTVIIGEMPELSMFKILPAIDRPNIGGDSGSGEIALSAGSPIDETRFFDLILVDNLDGYIKADGKPISTMQTVPMITVEKGTRFTCENVKFIGKLNSGAVSGRDKTLQAIGGYVSGTGGVGSHLTLRKCFFDGMRIAANFEPGNGALDFLTIDQCRARTFGTEDSTLTAVSDNCFVSMSLCNLIATNNYFVGYGTFPTQAISSCFVITSGSGGSGGTDVRILVSGTTGSPSSGISTAKSVLIDETAAINYKAVVVGNNWASDVDNKWYVTVGQGDSNTTGYFGDFVGSGAIDLIFSSSFAYPTTVIVNPGTYVVTNSGSSSYNFIGNKIGSSIPIFDMKISSATTDHIGNRIFTTGPILKSIKFRSSTVQTSNYHSIRPGGSLSGARSIEVSDCIFENTALSVAPGSSSTDSLNLLVKTCRFEQTAAYADNLSLLLPALNQTIVEGCHFIGNGYVGLIGDDSTISYTTTSVTMPTVIVRDCVMDPTDFIDGVSPLGTDAYFIVDETAAQVYIENCKIGIADLALSVDLINASLATTFTKFVFIRGQNVFIDKTIVNGPMQTFTSGLNTYPIPAIQIVPGQSLRVNNSKFRHGGIPMQITGLGGNAFSSSGDPSSIDGAVIDNCWFNVSSSAISNTLLDIELTPVSGLANQNVPKLTISNSKFHLPDIASVNIPLHSDIDSDGYSYIAHGIVQVHAPDFEINVHDNLISGGLFGTMPTGFDHVSGLVIDNVVEETGSLGSFIAPINVSRNRIIVINAFTSATAAETSSALWLRGTALHVHDNHLSMDNDAIVSSSKISVMYIENRNIVAGTTSPAIVSGNTFSKRDIDGDATSLSGGYIFIPSTTTGDGMIVNNAFSDPTDVTSGPEVAATINAALPASWVVERNRNQQELMRIGVGCGAIGLEPAADEFYGHPMNNGSGSIASYVTWGDAASTSNQFRIYYRDTTTTKVGHWVIPLEEILPHGVYIKSISAVVDVSANAAGGGTHSSTLSLVTSAATETDTVASITTAGATHTLDEGTDWTTNFQRVTSAGAMAFIELVVSLLSTTNTNFDCDAISVTYRY